MKKVLCISASNTEATFKLKPDTIVEPRHYYSIEPASTGTNAQNRAFHALCMEYYKSGLHKYNKVTFEEFRNCIKRDIGAGFCEYHYSILINGESFIKKAKTYEEIPLDIRNSKLKAQKIIGRLKSWSKYTKKQRQSTISLLISEMLQVELNTKKFHEILDGIEKINLFQ